MNKKRINGTLILCFTLLCLFCLAGVIPAKQATADGRFTVFIQTNLSDNTAKINRTDPIELTYRFTNNTHGMYSIDGAITYDPNVFEYDSYDSTGSAHPSDNTLARPGDFPPGVGKLSVVTSPANGNNYYGDGLFIRLYFRLKSGAQPGVYTFGYDEEFFALDIDAFEAGDESEGVIDANFQPIDITVSAGSTDKEIKSLKVNGKAVSGMTAEPVAYADTTASVTAVVDTAAVLEIAGSSATSGVAKTVQLTAGQDTNIPIKVMPESGTPETYTLTIPRAAPSESSELVGLKVNNTTVERTGSSYPFSVTYSTTSVTVAAECSPFATMTFDGAAWNGAAKTVSGLMPGLNEKKIIVTAQNGTSTNEYTLKITRSAASGDAWASSVSVNGGANLTLNGSEYRAAAVPYEAGTATVKVVIPASASMTIAGVSVQSGESKTVSLTPNNETVLALVVTAEDGVSKAEYTVVIPRMAASADRDIVSLKVNGTEVLPQTSENYISQPVAFNAVTAKIRVAIPQTASLRVNGEAVGANVDYTVTLTPNADTEVVLRVIAQNGDGTDYSLTIPRNVLSSDNSLTTLSVNGEEIMCVGVRYAYTLPYTQSSVSVTAVPAPLATMTLNGSAWNGSAKQLSGLAVGANQYEIIVKAQNGNSATYTLSITRLAASADRSITQLTVNGQDAILSGSTYTVSALPFSTSSVKVTITIPETADLTVGGRPEVSGVMFTVDTPSLENIFAICVTAQNGTPGNYTLIVPKLAQSNDNAIKALSVSGELVIASGTTYVAREAAKSVRSVTLSIAVHEFATVKIGSATYYPDYVLSLNANADTTVTITVTAEDGTPKDYTLTVPRAVSLSSDATVKAILVDGKEVAGSSPNYAATVSHQSTETVLRITVAGGATLTVNENLVSSGVNYTLALRPGENTVKIKVVAEDGTATGEYTLLLTRTVPSVENGIESILVNGTPVVSSGTLAYTAAPVSFSATSVELVVTPKSTDATVTVDGVRYEGGTVRVNLVPGADTVVAIVVTAESGASAAYELTVPRFGVSSACAILSLTVEGRAATQNGTTYGSDVLSFGTLSAKVCIYISPAAVMTVDGEPLSSGLTRSVILTGVTTKINIVVTAENATDFENYTLIIVRDAGSGANKLTRLEVDGNILTADGDVFRYAVTGTSGEVTLSASGPEFALMYLDGTLWSGASVKIEAIDGAHEIKVIAQDGTDRVYALYIEVREIGSNNQIAVIEVKGSAMRFDKSKTVYDVEIAPDAAFADILVLPEDVYAQVRGLSESRIVLSAGQTKTLVVYAVAENGEAGVEYRLNIKRILDEEVKLSKLYLSGLSVGESGPYQIALDPESGSRDFKVTVPGNLSSLDIAAELPFEGYRVEGLGVHSLKNTGTDKPNYITIRIFKDSGAAPVRLATGVTTKTPIAEYTIEVIRETTGIVNESLSVGVDTLRRAVFILAAVTLLCLIIITVLIVLLVLKRKKEDDGGGSGDANDNGSDVDTPKEEDGAEKPTPVPSEVVDEKESALPKLDEKSEDLEKAELADGGEEKPVAPEVKIVDDDAQYVKVGVNEKTMVVPAGKVYVPLDENKETIDAFEINRITLLTVRGSNLKLHENADGVMLPQDKTLGYTFGDIYEYAKEQASSVKKMREKNAFSYRVNGKSFLMTSQRSGKVQITFKCGPAYAKALMEVYPQIVKSKFPYGVIWFMIDADEQGTPLELVKLLIDISYAITLHDY